MSVAANPWVLVTGFGPFGSHSVNPSLQAVQRLPDVLFVAFTNDVTEAVTVVKRDLPVAYDAADTFYREELPQLCEQNGGQPVLIVHVGVNGDLQRVELEQNAFNQSDKLDIRGKRPASGKCCDQQELCHKQGTDLDLQQVVNAVQHDWQQAEKGALALGVSLDAGRFLWCAPCVQLVALHLRNTDCCAICACISALRVRVAHGLDTFQAYQHGRSVHACAKLRNECIILLLLPQGICERTLSHANYALYPVHLIIDPTAFVRAAITSITRPASTSAPSAMAAQSAKMALQHQGHHRASSCMCRQTAGHTARTSSRWC